MDFGMKFSNVDKPYGYLFARMEDNLYFVMIMKLRKSSLRQMIRSGLVNDRIKKKVLEELKPIVVGEDDEVRSLLNDAFVKPDNILVDYALAMDSNGLNGQVVNFEMAVTDWGTSGDVVEHFGGTPMYASRYAFTGNQNKDLFAFGRIAIELYLESAWLAVTFYPIEDNEMVQRLRQKLSLFLRAIQKCSSTTDYDAITIKRICDEITSTASSDVDNQLVNDLNVLMRRPGQLALNKQHDAHIDVNNLLYISRSSFQHYDLFKRTVHLVQSYQRENSLITDHARSRGSSSYTCWAFSCASMLRASCKLLINQCRDCGLVDDERKKLFYEYTSRPEVHVEIRNLTMMILLPRKLHLDDETQAAFVRAAVSRIANPTVMEPRGIIFLRPVWFLITQEPHEYGNKYGLDLDEDDVDVYYKKYMNNFKRALLPDEESIEQAVKNQLTPVASVDFSGSAHAMVLDSIVNDEFVFKNTYRGNNNDYQVKMPVTAREAPMEFYFVHIKVKDEKIYLALSCASMLLTSCELLVEQCHELGIIPDKIKQDCMEYITGEVFNVGIRKGVMKILPFPCDLKDAVSRIANPTMLEYGRIKPLREWIASCLRNSITLGLYVHEVAIHHKTYINNFKRTLTTKEESVEQAVNDGLTPVATADFNGSPRVMALDSITNGEFIFKNTYRGHGEVKVPVASQEAPDEFYFVHIKVKEDKIGDIKRRDRFRIVKTK